MKLINGLETERCYLQLFNYKDIKESIELYTNPDARKYLGGPITEEVAIKKLKKSMQTRKVLHLWQVYYTVRLKESGKLIGIISITPYHNLRCNELSYQFKPDSWGNGYAYETIRGLIPFCKSHLGLRKIVSETQSANHKSCKLLERLGYKLHRKLTRFGSEQSLYKLNIH